MPESEGSGCVWVGRHGKPVDAVLVGEQGTMAVSAGGPIMRVWDLLGASTSRSGALDGGFDVEGGAAAHGGEDVEEDTGTQYCLKALSNHQKAITTLCWGESEQGEKRVLSGGLDGLVKVYDPQENWRVRHTMRYGGQVMSLAVSVRPRLAPPSSGSGATSPTRLFFTCSPTTRTSSPVSRTARCRFAPARAWGGRRESRSRR